MATGREYTDDDWARIVSIGLRAVESGERISVMLSRELDITEAYARSLVSRARTAGYPVPYQRVDLVDRNDLEAAGEYELVASREPWMEQGECRGLDPELFFPTRGGDSSTAKSICTTCPVADECLDYALRTCQKYGIWGGASERDRRGMRRRNREERAAHYRELIA